MSSKTSFATILNVGAPKAKSTSVSQKASAKTSGSSNKNVVTTKPKAKLAPRPLGTGLVNFVGWKYGEGCLYFPSQRDDFGAFRCALRAAVIYGKSEDTSRKSKTAVAGLFWSASIEHDLDPRELRNMTQTVHNDVTTVGKLDLPKVGSIFGKAVWDKLRQDVRTLSALNHCGMGTGGVLRGMASVLGSEFNSWLDFVWYCVIQKTSNPAFKAYVENGMAGKIGLFARVIDFYPVEYTDAPPEGGGILYLSKVPAGGVEAIKSGWRPFLPGYTGAEYFAGTSGIYNVGPVDKMTRDTLQPTFQHWINYFGVLGFYLDQKIYLSNYDSFVSAWKHVKEKRSGVPKINVGFNALGFSSGTDGDDFKTPDKSSWDYVCGHYKNALPAPAPAPMFDRILGEGESRVISHKNKPTIRAEVVRLQWKYQGNPVKGYIWRSECLECNKAFYVTPEKMLDDSLLEPAKKETINPPLDGEFPNVGDQEGEDDDEAAKDEPAPEIDDQEEEDGDGEDKGKEKEKEPIKDNLDNGFPLQVIVKTRTLTRGDPVATMIYGTRKCLVFDAPNGDCCFYRANKNDNLGLSEIEHDEKCDVSGFKYSTLVTEEGKKFSLIGSLYGYLAFKGRCIPLAIRIKDGVLQCDNLEGVRIVCPADESGRVLRYLLTHLQSAKAKE